MAYRHESVLSASSFVSFQDVTSSLEFSLASQVRNVEIAVEKLLANKGMSAAIAWALRDRLPGTAWAALGAAPAGLQADGFDHSQARRR